MSTHYHYIIVGAGAAGLSLIVRMLDAEALRDKKILLIDKGPKTRDDRTWCFWENKPGYFEEVVFHQWDNLWVRHPSAEVKLAMEDYSYKMIRGIDFYRYCFNKLKGKDAVQIVYGNVENIDADHGKVTVDGYVYTGEIIFSSLMPSPPLLQSRDRYLLQHFRGWWLQTPTDFFEPSTADLMNFRVSQQYGCAFVYVMPVTKRSALVEYTLFSASELSSGAYDDGLRNFIDQELGLTNYSIDAVENGVIPMTTYRFPQRQGKVVYIGTAGGQTKASTGYTFMNIQRHSALIVYHLVKGGASDFARPVSPRFRYYDRVLLRVLDEGRISGADVFFRMFQKNPASRVLRFLNDESTFCEDLAIMNTTPKGIFLPAAMAEMW